MSSERVICVVETKLDLSRGLWWAIDFSGAVDARVLPAGASSVPAFLLDTDRPTIGWLVLADPYATVDDLDQHRYVVGVQRTKGLDGAPREHLAWSVHRQGDTVFSVFDLGTRRRSAHAAEAARVGLIPPFEINLWNCREPK